MLLMRIAIPDRPGSLGAVATAMGTVGADILAVEIIERHETHVVDDFMLELPDRALPDSLVSAVQQLEDVDVLWLSHYPESWGLESDIELLERMTSSPEEAAAILTEAAPVVFHCHWALLADRATGETLTATALAPELAPHELAVFAPVDKHHGAVLPEGWLPHWGEAVCLVAPVRHRRVVVLGRQGGPSWLPSEVARLRFLAGMAP